ncbi:hypothetical protein QSJ19_26150 [Gordonia sp. ABSL11-1]|uniref:hypothetical protein n=1 Tax=Gordonia sp. ABSL11-1 TaxID=3053924 RepID=UPI0025740ACA|nr:hypothetical protein [Gordonia sp. ABSL11-1]MDL9948999.1 hypothetical protein [Gordonia sp. ABSL11-1]
MLIAASLAYAYLLLAGYTHVPDFWRSALAILLIIVATALTATFLRQVITARRDRRIGAGLAKASLLLVAPLYLALLIVAIVIVESLWQSPRSS